MQVMKGEQIQASGLDYLVELPRSHVAVVTEGYVPMVCENGTQRLPPNYGVANQPHNGHNMWGSGTSSPEMMPGAWGRVVQKITGLHRGVAPTDFDKKVHYLFNFWGRVITKNS